MSTTYFNNLMIRLDAAGKKTINFNLNSKISGSTTVGELKKLIEDREGVSDVRLVYLTKQLEKNELRLRDYNVNDGATLFAVFRLLGGSMPVLDETKLKKFEDEYKISVSQCSINKSSCAKESVQKIELHCGHRFCSGCMRLTVDEQVKKKKNILNCLCGAAINVGLAVSLANFSQKEADTIEKQFKLKVSNKGTFNQEQVKKFGVTVSCDALCAWNMSSGCRDKETPKVTLRCGHTFCSDCMDKYINDRIAIRAVNIVCPFVCENVSYLTNELAFTIANYDEKAWNKAVSKFRQNGASKTSTVMYADLFLLFLRRSGQVYPIKLEQGKNTKIETLLGICDTLGAYKADYEKPLILRNLEVLNTTGQKTGSQEGAGKENAALTLEDHKVVNWTTLDLETYRHFNEAAVNEIKMEDDFKLSSWSLTTSDCSLGISEACSMKGYKRLKVQHKDNNSTHTFCNTCLFESLGKSMRIAEHGVRCPLSCSELVPLPLVFAFCNVPFEERKEYEQTFTENLLSGNNSWEIKVCPNEDCKSYVFRNIKEFRVKCPRCRSNDWCWLCHRPWKGRGFVICGNSDCDMFLHYSQWLEASGRKTIPFDNIPDVPERRLCPNPKCLAQTTHQDKCKEVKCPACSHRYCFCCLRRWYACKCNLCSSSGSKPPSSCSHGQTDCDTKEHKKLQTITKEQIEIALCS